MFRMVCYMTALFYALLIDNDQHAGLQYERERRELTEKRCIHQGKAWSNM